MFPSNAWDVASIWEGETLLDGPNLLTKAFKYVTIINKIQHARIHAATAVPTEDVLWYTFIL